MKKITLMLASVMAFSGVNAQDGRMAVKKSVGETPFQTTVSQHRNATPATVAAVIFTEDFGGGIPAGWSVTDNVASGEVWTYAMGPGGPTIALGDTLMSNTMANGFMMVDDDLYGSTSPANNTDLTTPAINCTGFTNIHVSFMEYFKQFAATAELQISTDNATWTPIYDPTAGLGQNQGSANPKYVDIDISSIADGAATVYIRWHYEGDWDYWWQVDDIMLYEAIAADGQALEVTSVVSGCGLTSSETVGISIRNAGTAAISGFNVNYTVNGGTPVTEMVTGTINPGDTLVHTFAAAADLSTAGTYTIVVYTSVPSDGNTFNDTASVVIENIPSNNLASAYTNGFEPGESIAGWLPLDLNGDGVTWAISAPGTPPVDVHAGAHCMRKGPGAGVDEDDWIFTSCFDLLAGTNYTFSHWAKKFDNQFVAALEVRIGNSQDPSAMTQLLIADQTDTVFTLVTSNFTVPLSGMYYIGYHTFSSSAASALRVDDITLEINTGIGESIAERSIAIFPNPASSQVTLQINRPYDVASLNIINALGESVYSAEKISVENTIDVSSLQSGIYTAKLTIDGKEVNKRFTVAK